ncbi:hypothetical protein [Clostridium sp. YIM B02551]|uniref:hypothetical protein n=1 Tax=Clostridium sp. YIM B02551 TaxID=2910679 RepID=UPI001EECCB0A|nr:hypothetical protein [Clostridium sp. YIM B02551]
MKIKLGQDYTGVKEGWYYATFIKYVVKGTKDTSWGRVQDGFLYFKLDNGVVVRQYSYLVGWKNSLPRKLILAVKGNVKECDLDSLTGSEVGVEIKNTIALTDTYTNVIDIISKEDVEEKIREQNEGGEEEEFQIESNQNIFLNPNLAKEVTLGDDIINF